MKQVAALLGVTCILAPTRAPAQFWDKLSNPKITVQVAHPPELGLKIESVAFGPAKGQKAEEFVAELQADFGQSGMKLFDRQHLDSILAEHNFSASGFVDTQTTAALGKILGATALVFVDVHRSATEQTPLRENWKDGKGYYHVTYISRTEASFKASVRIVDVSTGQMFRPRNVDVAPRLENKAQDQCCPEFPSPNEAMDLALKQAVWQVHKLLFRWSEPVPVYFFDDKDCNLKTAYQFLKAGDVEGALRQSELNLEACKVLPKAKEKNQAHAYYNVGLARFLLGDYDKAMESFTESNRVKPTDITTEAMAECSRAKQLAQEVRRVEERVAFEGSLGKAQPSGTAPRSTAPGGKADAKTQAEVRCAACKELVPDGAKFCPKCGKRVQAAPTACAKCGVKIPTGAKFCPSCGAPVAK